MLEFIIFLGFEMLCCLMCVYTFVIVVKTVLIYLIVVCFIVTVDFYVHILGLTFVHHFHFIILIL